MSLPDPSFLPALRVVHKTRDFHKTVTLVDGETKTLTWRVTFEAQEGFPQQILIEDTARDLSLRYIVGSVKVEAGNGQVIPVSDTLCDRIALLMALDKSEPSPGEIRYDFARWAILAERATDVFLSIFTFAADVIEEARGTQTAEAVDAEGLDLKNDWAAFGESSSTPPRSSETSIPTL